MCACANAFMCERLCVGVCVWTQARAHGCVCVHACERVVVESVKDSIAVVLGTKSWAQIPIGQNQNKNAESMFQGRASTAEKICSVEKCVHGAPLHIAECPLRKVRRHLWA